MGEDDDEKRRWSVTYTKHLKQKRKVYQDGFLDLHVSTDKLMLYDDCEKLLGCRILKKDEVLSSGETLAFNSYLVDIGDPEGGQKPPSNSNLQNGINKLNRNFDSQGKVKIVKVEKDKPTFRTLSPTHRIIREFKRSQQQNNGSSQSNTNTAKPSKTEWQVMYTTQMTQKAKKYHDGFLEMTVSGSLHRQVTLFDDSRKQLDNRFLKKDEIIKSGESIAFDSHLVEIGECNGNDFHRDNGNMAPTVDTMYKKENPLGSLETTQKEWQVMYTPQVTQKAKKYHDGFLRMANGGLLGRQVMLYDDGKTLLSSRFLKNEEVIRSGEPLRFNTYLVDVGELEENKQQLEDLKAQRTKVSNSKKTGMLHELQNRPKEWQAMYTSQITQKVKKYSSGFLRLALCGSYQMQVKLLSEDKLLLSSKFLSLSEEFKTGNTYALPKYLVEVGEPLLELEVKSQSIPGSRKNENTIICISPEEEVSLSGRMPTMKPSQDKKVAHFSAFSLDETNSNFGSNKVGKTINTNKSFRNASQILAFLQKPKVEQSCAGAIQELQDSNASKCCSADAHLLEESLVPVESEVNVETYESRRHEDLERPVSCKEIHRSCEEVSMAKPVQADSKAYEGMLASESDDATHMEEIPSFDLGF